MTHVNVRALENLIRLLVVVNPGRRFGTRIESAW